MRKIAKPVLLSAALLAALTCAGAAIRQQNTTHAEQGAAETGVQAAQLSAQAPYVLREVDGMVAVFREGKLEEQTEIPAELLRKADRQALQEGISAGSLEELLRLIEDFDS